MNSLLNLCIKSVAQHLNKFENDDILKYLPYHMKNKIIIYATRVHNGIKKKSFLQLLLNRELGELDLSNFDEIDNEILHLITDKSPNLKRIIFNSKDYKFDRLTFLILFIKLSKTIEEITLRDCGIIDDHLMYSIMKFCRQLTMIDLSGCRKLTNNCIEGLKHLINLQQLNLSKTNIGDEFLERFSETHLNNTIVDINLSNTNITATGLSKLKWNHLKYIGFEGINLSSNNNALEFINRQNKNLKYISWTISN